MDWCTGPAVIDTSIAGCGCCVACLYCVRACALPFFFRRMVVAGWLAGWGGVAVLWWLRRGSSESAVDEVGGVSLRAVFPADRPGAASSLPPPLTRHPNEVWSFLTPATCQGRARRQLVQPGYPAEPDARQLLNSRRVLSRELEPRYTLPLTVPLSSCENPAMRTVVVTQLALTSSQTYGIDGVVAVGQSWASGSCSRTQAKCR
jgi:hypothetical protein